MFEREKTVPALETVEQKPESKEGPEKNLGEKEDPFELLHQLIKLDDEKEMLGRKERVKNLKQRWLLWKKILENKGGIKNQDERARLQRGMVRWSLALGEETHELTKSLPERALDKIRGALKTVDDALDEAFFRAGNKVFTPVFDNGLVKLLDYLSELPEKVWTEIKVQKLKVEIRRKPKGERKAWEDDWLKRVGG